MASEKSSYPVENVDVRIETDNNNKAIYLVIAWDVTHPEGWLYIVEKRTEAGTWEFAMQGRSPGPGFHGRGYIPIGIRHAGRTILSNKTLLVRVRVSP